MRCGVRAVLQSQWTGSIGAGSLRFFYLHVYTVKAKACAPAGVTLPIGCLWAAAPPNTRDRNECYNSVWTLACASVYTIGV